mgnify:CR=1 FL=1
MKIGICGKMCSGKTTLANKIIDFNKNKKYVKDSFANKVYEIAYELFNMKEKDRYLLQQIGTNMRNIDNNVWINYIISKHKDTKNIIIDDVRYKNELLELKKNGYFLIKLKISSELQKKRIINLYKSNSKNHLDNINHSSEISLDNTEDEMFNLIINIDKDDIDNIISTQLS